MIPSMSDCNCTSIERSRSWIDLQNATPRDPLDLIADMAIGAVVPTYKNSTDFLSGAWTGSGNWPVVSDPVCTSLAIDDLATVADAEQWTFSHITRNAASTLAPQLQNELFLRAGERWEMQFRIDTTGVVSIEVSFLMNAATRGDYAGTVAVLEFIGPPAGPNTLVQLTLKQLGAYRMGMRFKTGTDLYMLESNWRVVP